MARQTNKVSVKITQTLPSYVKPNGETVQERNYSFEHSDETKMDITAGNLSNFLLINLLRFMEIARLSGQDTFKLSKPMQVQIKVNDKEGMIQTQKLSMNPERFEKIMQNEPHLMAAIFTPTTNIGKLNDSEAKKFIGVRDIVTTDTNGETVIRQRIAFAGKNTVIAKAIKKMKEQPLPELPAIPAENVETADFNQGEAFLNEA